MQLRLQNVSQCIPYLDDDDDVEAPPNLLASRLNDFFVGGIFEF